MGTKLKNFSRNTFTKFIAFLIVAIMISMAVIQLMQVDWEGYNIEPLLVETYEESNTFANELERTFRRIYSNFNNNEETLIENENLIYYINDGKKTITNREEFNREDFIHYSNYFYEYNQGNFESDSSSINKRFTLWFGQDTTMYIAFNDGYMKEKQEDWNDANHILRDQAIEFSIYMVIAIILIIFLINVTGKKPKKEELQTTWIDQLYSEILLALFILPIIAMFIYVLDNYYYYTHILRTPSIQGSGLYLVGIVTTICALLSGVGLLALVRKIKKRNFIKGFILYVICWNTKDFVKSLFDGRRYAKYPLTKNLHKRQLAFIIGSGILILLTIMFIHTPLVIFPPLLELVLIYWYVKYNNKTYDEINKGINESLEEQMKSERMKIELITNVSHDLKTPLTSIISYVDLLSKETDLSDTAKDYVKILAKKSDRLKNIVSDLFDLAKSNSGDINLNLETIDMRMLIEQTLLDMEDSIEDLGQIKMKSPDTPIEIVSDGNKLYRVIQNVLDNAFKYSLKGTRIFIEIEEKNGMGIATIKNTSSYEIDFTADEILQRFNRGDKARTEDGSGLGLSIAESFTHVSGGIFKVDIDGDMFKVAISFPLARK
ncbi:HAMP domain-containing histidine kinase [Ornithinibacillus massiliensis]|uniref:histidine kinase n=1 Tax=Ornithinibacillus massiliensis TaxID=1944633 RepID=A0ABS5M8Z4_9BACI|nr:HAMP domain-containing sensor histidine kinase [Ornithinibacillus massiliensis]MBS3678786.1 HAMP domain-containing histidine kinase [Ornithinibacillus massiliensis]